MNAGAPSAAMRRYVTAPSATSPSPPISDSERPRERRRRATSSTQRRSRSDEPLRLRADARGLARCSPGAVQPRHLRGRPVGEEVEDVNAVVSTVAAIASEASCVVPRWPTIAVSTST